MAIQNSLSRLSWYRLQCARERVITSREVTIIIVSVFVGLIDTFLPFTGRQNDDIDENEAEAKEGEEGW